MTWTDRLNAAVPRLLLDGLAVDVYEWAHWSDEVVNPPHRHTYFEVCRVEGGHGTYVVADRRYQITDGDLLFIRPGVRHQIVSAEPPGIRLSWVAFDVSPGPGPAGGDAEVAGVFREFTRTELALARDDGRVGAVWEALRSAAGGHPRRGQRAELAALATALLLALARAGAGEPPPVLAAAPYPQADPDLADPGLADPGSVARTVRHAVRYIHDNLDRPLRVTELARHVHVSPRQLTRLFATHVGASPADYVERVRLERAAALLVRTPSPIKQIAATVGYPGVVPFTRAFTRRHGQPPGRFRRAGDLSGVLTAPPPAPSGLPGRWPDLATLRPVPAKTAR